MNYALVDLDPSGGGRNIPLGTLAASGDSAPEACGAGGYNSTVTVELFERYATGPTVITGLDTNPVFVPGNTFNISYSTPGNVNVTGPFLVTMTGTTSTTFVTNVSAALPSGSPVSATISSSGAITFVHSQGGAITVKDISGTPIADAGFNTTIEGVRPGTAQATGGLFFSNWTELDYTSSATAPDQDPADGRYWYYSATDQVDIMIQDGGAWQGYKNVDNDVRGYDLTVTDPAGPIVSASAPIEQSDGTDSGRRSLDRHFQSRTVPRDQTLAGSGRSAAMGDHQQHGSDHIEWCAVR